MGVDQKPPLEQLRRIARLFDSAFELPGTGIRFGIDPLLGLLPGIGDLATPILTLAILWHAVAARVPRIVLARMVLNGVIDAGVGAIPVLGDLFDVAWKANNANVALLERHARTGVRATSGDYLFVTLCAVVVLAVALVPLLMLWLVIGWVWPAGR